ISTLVGSGRRISADDQVSLAPGEAVVLKTRPDAPPATQTPHVAALIPTADATSVGLSWSRTAGATAYDVFCGSNRVATTTQVSWVGTLEQSARYHVEAVMDDGRRSPSSTVQVEPQGTRIGRWTW